MITAVLLVLLSLATDLEFGTATSTCDQRLFLTAVRDERLSISNERKKLIDELEPLLQQRIELAKREEDASRVGSLKRIFTVKYNRSKIAEERRALERSITTVSSKQKIIDLKNDSLGLKIEKFKLSCMPEEYNAPNQ